MIISLADFLEMRLKKGLKWPSKKMIYYWSHINLKGFKKKVIRKLGNKTLISMDDFEEWLLDSCINLNQDLSLEKIIPKITNKCKSNKYIE